VAQNAHRLQQIAVARENAIRLLTRATHPSMQEEIRGAMHCLSLATDSLRNPDVSRRSSILQMVDLSIEEAACRLVDAEKALDTYGNDITLRH
jgi:hypothetical protein